jgi:hypothetical protein
MKIAENAFEERKKSLPARFSRRGEKVCYENLSLMAFVEQASTHLRHMMHSGCVNFSQGSSRIGTSMGQTFTQSRHPALVQRVG